MIKVESDTSTESRCESDATRVSRDTKTGASCPEAICSCCFFISESVCVGGGCIRGKLKGFGL